MRIARIGTTDGPAWAAWDGAAWRAIDDPLAAGSPASAGEGAVLDGPLLAPVQPTVLIGIAHNAPETGQQPIQAWLKSPRTVVASGAPVRLRRDAGQQVAEGEIAVVIGRSTRGLTRANAHESVLGVTAVNDLSSPDRAAHDPRNFESKAGEGFTPLGPWIETDVDLDRIGLAVRIDGVERARTSSAELPSSIAECLAYVATWMELGPGDVVMTGAPRSNVAIEPGALVEVDVAGMTLATPCQ